jgi:hypothetical protein
VIRNATRNTILAKQYALERGLGKLKGLLRRNEAEPLVFETRLGIHTFFLKFPIDLLILDNKGRVKLAKTVRQNRIAVWNPIFKTVVELPAGTLLTTGTKLGDKIVL